MNEKETVFVALSGGVDSAVTAHILKEKDYKVVGVFIRVWQPDFTHCTQDEEEQAAKRVAAHLGIQFKRLNLSKEYKEEVVDEMIAEYKRGRTPNPDVLCNASIKFGAFLKYALENGADKIATGHHAQIVKNESSDTSLMRGVDEGKDQSYFLWKLTKEQLSHTLMPIGAMQKSEVREYAEKHTIPSAYKPDSQGLCFIGHIDMKSFLKEFIPLTPGKVLNTDGEVIGSHQGVEVITLGQRSGFTIDTDDTNRSVHYVVAKDIQNATITVSESELPPTVSKRTFTLIKTNWSKEINEDTPYTAQIRYHGKKYECRITKTADTEATITFNEPLIIASGQSVVLYEGKVCVGGGVVE